MPMKAAPENLALGRPTRQSSDYVSRHYVSGDRSVAKPEHAVDGDFEYGCPDGVPNGHFCTHTQSDWEACGLEL